MNVLSENIQSMREAAKKIVGNPDPSTLFRWAKRGCRSRTGKLIRLDSAKIGGKVWTSTEAVARFMEALNAPAKSATAA